MFEPRIAVLFRTYQWDDFARRSAERIALQADGMDLFISVDETNSGPVDTAPFRKLAHTTTTMEARGLRCLTPAGAAALWWNCDYAIYDGMLAAPGYDYYLNIEDDVAVNTPLRPFIGAMGDQNIDCVPTFGPNPVARWSFRSSLETLPYPDLSWCALSTVFLTARAAKYLYDERVKLGQEHVDGEPWAMCEGFVSSALRAGGFSVVELRALSRLEHFGTEVVLLETDPRASEPGTFAHSVLDLERFIAKFKSRYLRAMLSAGLRRDLAASRTALLNGGRSELDGWRILAATGNLALDRPARQSSVSPYSRRPMWAHLDPNAVDAEGGNCGVLTGDAGFHTDVEANPWWQVDLGAGSVVGRVRLYNRRVAAERARRLSILVSDDERIWITAFHKADERVFAGPDDPLDCTLAMPATCRFVRVSLDGTDYLHLDEIEVFAA